LVRGFNAFPHSMLSLLISQNHDAWHELTLTDEHFSDDLLPIWGTLWAFDDSADIAWLESEAGISAMSNCGFRIFYHDDFGYFFGIDGAGYDFYEEHWIPLYLARGLHCILIAIPFKFTILGEFLKSIILLNPTVMNFSLLFQTTIKFKFF
jgi:hypothetical protein